MHGSARGRWGAFVAPALLGAMLLGVPLVATGCAPSSTPDPALTSTVADALGSARTVQLGLDPAAAGSILPTTQAVVVGDMADELADAARELELQKTSTPADAEYREAALRAARAALAAVHAAQQGEPGANAALREATDALAELDEEASG